MKGEDAAAYLLHPAYVDTWNHWIRPRKQGI